MLQHTFRVGGQLLVFIVTAVRRGELDQFHLLKLVLPDEATHVAAVGAGLGTEAGRIGTEADGECGFVQGFIAEEIRDWNFGGGDQPMIVVVQIALSERAFIVAVKEVLSEFRQLAGAEERAGVDHVGRQNFRIAVLAGVQVQHEVGQGALKPGTRAVVKGEAGTGDFGRAIEVEDVQGFAELPMGFGREVEGWLLAVTLDKTVAVLVGALRHVGLRQVWKGFENAAEFGIATGGGGFQRVGAFRAGCAPAR